MSSTKLENVLKQTPASKEPTAMIKPLLYSNVVVRASGLVLKGQLVGAERSGHGGGLGNIILKGCQDLSRNVRFGLVVLRESSK